MRKWMIICFLSCLIVIKLNAQHKYDTVLIRYLNPIDTLNPKVGQFILTHNIYFELDGPAIIREISFPVLDSIGSIVRIHPRWLVEVGEFYQCRGSSGEMISTQWAKSVRNYLIRSSGCLPSSILARGYGSAQPLIPCTNFKPFYQNTCDTFPDADLMINQRFEFRIKDIRAEDNVNPIDTIHPKIGQFAILQVYYDLDRSHLMPESERHIDSFASILKKHPCWVVEVSSFTDCRASYSHNDSLSLVRSKCVCALLSKYGCKPENLIPKGYGERQLLNNCFCEPNNVGPGKDCTEAEHALNRRTEVKIVGFRNGCK